MQNNGEKGKDLIGRGPCRENMGPHGALKHMALTYYRFYLKLSSHDSILTGRLKRELRYSVRDRGNRHYSDRMARIHANYHRFHAL